MNKKYVVYQHVTPDGMYYFGQSQNVERRWRNNGAGYKGTALYPYIQKYGWENIKHIVLFRDQTKEDALWIENFLIETAREDGVCINKYRSGNVSKEEGYQQQITKQYYEDNKDKIKQYYEDNKDKIKQYYEENKDKILEQQKQYYEENKDKILEQQKQYYEENKDKILEQQKQYRQRKKLEKTL